MAIDRDLEAVLVRAIATYTGQGYSITRQDSDYAELIKYKKFSFKWLILAPTVGLTLLFGALTGIPGELQNSDVPHVHPPDFYLYIFAVSVALYMVVYISYFLSTFRQNVYLRIDGHGNVQSGKQAREARTVLQRIKDSFKNAFPNA